MNEIWDFFFWVEQNITMLYLNICDNEIMLSIRDGVLMKPICETMALYVIPAIRAMVARDLMEIHKMTQRETAKKLGMTQPAVSQYRKHLRGIRTKTLEKDLKISNKISKISSSLAKNEINFQEATCEICEICKYIREKELTKKII